MSSRQSQNCADVTSFSSWSCEVNVIEARVRIFHFFGVMMSFGFKPGIQERGCQRLRSAWLELTDYFGVGLDPYVTP